MKNVNGNENFTTHDPAIFTKPSVGVQFAIRGGLELIQINAGVRRIKTLGHGAGRYEGSKNKFETSD